jgi:hypothetical protein
LSEWRIAKEGGVLSLRRRDAVAHTRDACAPRDKETLCSPRQCATCANLVQKRLNSARRCVAQKRCRRWGLALPPHSKGRLALRLALPMVRGFAGGLSPAPSPLLSPRRPASATHDRDGYASRSPRARRPCHPPATPFALPKTFFPAAQQLPQGDPTQLPFLG